MAARRTEDLIPVCGIQGSGVVSPFDGQLVRTRGVVYADFETLPLKGFYIQYEDCDGSPGTSDGIFVYTGGSTNSVQNGDIIEVNGVVNEYLGQTEIQAASAGVSILSHGNPLPSPVVLNPPLDDQSAAVYLESLEGMHVRMDKAIVIGPTDSAGDTWVINADRGIKRIFDDEPRGAVVPVSSLGYYKLYSPAKVSDDLVGLQGTLDGSSEMFRLHLLKQPELYPGDLPMETGAPTADQGFTLATFNLANLFDTQDDLGTNDTVLTAAEYQRRLEKRALAIHDILAEPDILVVQEVENLSVLQALVNRPEIVTNYKIVWEEGPDPRGLDIALLYRQEQVELLGYQVRQECTGLIDGLGPDGNGDVRNPANNLTCDRNGDGILDGNRLFSRPPLVIWLRIAVATDRTADVTVIANHWKSRLEDTREEQFTLARRMQQAQYTVALMQEMRGQREGDYIILAGDLNDIPGSEPLSILNATGVRDLAQYVERESRYSLIYQGVSQVIDYVLDVPYTDLVAAQVQALHINSDFPTVYADVDGTVYRSSDHDPLWVNIIPFTEHIHVPQVYSGD